MFDTEVSDKDGIAAFLMFLEMANTIYNDNKTFYSTLIDIYKE